ncbi:MAG: DegT/DnrJ/EryC1/StrS family aminotransferase [Candidatus Rariloculaceae bacterium]
MEFVDLKTPYRQLNESINARIQSVLDHGQYILGPEVDELQEKLAEYIGTKHCVGVSSGTDALLIALMACDVGPGDEVITSPFSFISTAEVILLLGAKPVFVDIDPQTYNIDSGQVEAAITDSTKVIVPVSLYGQCADFDEINVIANQYGLVVIEDGAQSFGASYRGRMSCALSNIGITSFFPSKPLGCYGDAGALFTDDEELARKILEIRLHGQDRRYHHARLGINGRMDTIQAAILLSKFEIFPDEVEARQQIANRYSSLIAKKTDGDSQYILSTPYVAPYNASVFAQYTIEVANREITQKKMQALGIPTAVHYPVPLHQQPVFSSSQSGIGKYLASESACANVLSLPMHPYLDESQQDSVIAALLESF